MTRDVPTNVNLDLVEILTRRYRNLRGLRGLLLLLEIGIENEKGVEVVVVVDERKCRRLTLIHVVVDDRD